MKYDNWKTVVGQHEVKEWNGRQYRFLISSNQQDEMRVIDSLQSQTPIRHFLEIANQDEIIRALSFLSYYQINPTFKQDGDGAGADFFWFPLDKLTNERLDYLSDRIEITGPDDEDQDDDDALLPDFPVMSTVGTPIIEAATSDTYVLSVGRDTKKDRSEILQEQIRERQKELVEEVENWLNEGLHRGKYPEDLSNFSSFVGRLPSYILLDLLEEESSRMNSIREDFINLDVPSTSDFESGPEYLLQKLNLLADDYPVFENPAIEAFCLDESNRDCQYHVTKNRGTQIDKGIQRCEYCNSGMFRIFRTGLNNRVQEAWMMGLLPELVVARVLDGCEWTKEVIPHRLVQLVKDNGDITSSVEVDVSVLTEEDKVLFFEVTTQRSALDRLHRKQSKFEENGIEYDGIVQVSPIDREQMLSWDDNVVATAGWMIKGLERPEFKEDLYNSIASLPDI